MTSAATYYTIDAINADGAGLLPGPLTFADTSIVNAVDFVAKLYPMRTPEIVNVETVEFIAGHAQDAS